VSRRASTQSTRLLPSESSRADSMRSQRHDTERLQT
jgi:hypothetical protein